MILKSLLVFLGSGIGGLARYSVSAWIRSVAGDAFPFATLSVNILGCALIGALSAAFSERIVVRDELRVALFVGLLGGFTTFSAFGVETFSLLRAARADLAALYIAASVLLGLGAVWTGYRLTQQWL